MASAAGGRASWMVAASVGAVQALKDQGGMCRWNHALRSLHQRAKSNMGSLAQAVRTLSSSSSSSVAADRRSRERAQESEESLRKVMYLSCWGPN